MVSHCSTRHTFYWEHFISPRRPFPVISTQPRHNQTLRRAERQIRSLGVKWSSAPYPAGRLLLHGAAPPTLCMFPHIYYSLCSQIARLCYIWNIKRSAIRRDVSDPGRNTLSLQTQFESTSTQLNDIHCSAANMNICVCVNALAERCEGAIYDCTACCNNEKSPYQTAHTAGTLSAVSCVMWRSTVCLSLWWRLCRYFDRSG